MHKKKLFIFKLKLNFAQWLKAKILACPAIENTFAQWLKIINFIDLGLLSQILFQKISY